MGLQSPSAPWVLSLSSSIGDPVLSPMVGCEHLPVSLSNFGRASQETAILGSCQHALLGSHNSVCVRWLYMGWISRWGSLWMAFPLVSAPPLFFFLLLGSEIYFVPIAACTSQFIRPWPRAYHPISTSPVWGLKAYIGSPNLK